VARLNLIQPISSPWKMNDCWIGNIFSSMGFKSLVYHGHSLYFYFYYWTINDPLMIYLHANCLYASTYIILCYLLQRTYILYLRLFTKWNYYNKKIHFQLGFCKFFNFRIYNCHLRFCNFHFDHIVVLEVAKPNLFPLVENDIFLL
jgi:hypothetical protein